MSDTEVVQLKIRHDGHIFSYQRSVCITVLWLLPREGTVWE